MPQIRIKPTLGEIRAKLDKDNIKTTDENQFYELKRPQNGIPDFEDFITEVVSFYNSLGGYIIIETNDLPKTKAWIAEHQWENTEKWKKNELDKINNKIMSDEYACQGKNYVIVTINRSEDPFGFASYDGWIFLRVGAHRKKVKFDRGDTQLIKEIMEQRMVSNLHKEAAEFWGRFYEKCHILFLDPSLMDTATPGLGHNPIYNECRSISINSQNISGLRDLHTTSVQLSAPTNVKKALDQLITAWDVVKSKKGSDVCRLVVLAAWYRIEIGQIQESIDKIVATKEWLKSVKEGA